MPDTNPHAAPPAPPAAAAVLEALTLGLYCVDGEGRCTFVNAAALDMLGYAEAELIGQPMHEAIHHSYPDGSPFPASACPITAGIRSGRPAQMANEVLWRRDGSFFTASAASVPLRRDRPGAGSVVTFTDTARQGIAADRLALQVSVSGILGSSADPEEVLPRFLAAIGTTLGFSAGTLWAVSHRDRRLTEEARWDAAEAAATAAAAGEGAEEPAGEDEDAPATLERGEGLPGRAWEETAMLTAPDEGGGTLVAVPAQIGRRVLGVMAFRTPGAIEPGDDMADNLAALGQQVGQYLRRRRAEAALRDREEEFRALAENLPQLTWIADAAGAVEWFNRRWYDYTGSTPGQSQDDGWRALIHPDHRDEAVQSFAAAIAAGRIWEATFPLRGQDGRYRWFLSRAVPIPDEEGRTGRWFGTSTDITQQRQAEARALAAERRMRFALQVARIGSWSWEFDAATLDADEGFRNLMDLPPGDSAIPEGEFVARIHPEDRARVTAAFADARRARDEFDIEFRILAADGSTRWAIARGAVERRPFTGRLYALGITWDVTERRQREEDLAAAKHAAEEANRAKSQFIANMSHELRTPLSAIIGYAELLEEEAADMGEEAGAMAADLAKIEASARHLLSLINGVLDLSKIEAGKMEVALETFEVAPLLAEVTGTVEGLVAQKGNAFDADIAGDLGAMHSDPVKLRQCLFNLLSNAAKFTEGGRIGLTVRRAGGALTFAVSDTGIGISPEQQERLFQRFTQADASTTRRFGGTGLGLALTRAFAQMLGGTITLDSAEGRGTTFTLTLPADATGAAAAATADGPAATRTAAPGAVLVIDDEPAMRDLIERHLTRDGFAVVTAPGGAEGLAMARAIAPAAILLDVMMPRVDGWAVLSALKADPALSAIPVIMLSMIRETGLAYSLGAADYLTKPVDWPRLKASLAAQHIVPAVPAGTALLVEPDAATREDLAAHLTAEGWAVRQAADGAAALALLAEAQPDLILVNLDDAQLDGIAVLGEVRRSAAGRAVPVIALTEGTLPPEERARLRGQVRRVIPPGEDGFGELSAELRRLAGARAEGQEERG